MTPHPNDDPIAALLERELFGVKLGLDNIRTLCAALGHPELACPTVIVAGTNGKGSVTAMASAALTAAGHRTARYTSPHLVQLEERFAVDGVPVSRERLVAALCMVFDAEARCCQTGRLTAPVTFFELTTAAAFLIFRDVAAGVAVLEVGLGGRHDATNVALPVAGAITTIDLDHTAHLGASIPEIAAEKAGIIKRGMTVVHGERKPEAVEVFEAAAVARGAVLVDAFGGTAVSAALENGDSWITMRTPRRDYGRLRLSLRGRHQVANAVVATRLLEVLDGLGIYVGEDAIRAGLTTTRWAGRLDIVDWPGGARIILDAAHNPAGAATLAAYLREALPEKLPIVFGAMRDKDVAGMLTALVPVARKMVFTRAAVARAMPCADLAAISGVVNSAVPATCAETVTEAVLEALEDARTVVVTGSIFLVGELLGCLEREASVPGPVRGV